MLKQAILLHPQDTVAVLPNGCEKGETILVDQQQIVALDVIPPGHKISVRTQKTGDSVKKYGYSIGIATMDILQGNHVHTHNLKTALQEGTTYTYHPGEEVFSVNPSAAETFSGYLRRDGRAGIRNELWIIPTVGCVNSIAQGLAEMLAEKNLPGVEGVFAFPHPYGCSQLGEDHQNTVRILRNLVLHPNAGGVLVLGLGCENNTMEQFRAGLGEYDPDRVRFLVCQEEEDEFAVGEALLTQLAEKMAADRRVPLPLSKLVIGLKCGGSDGLSGITANPFTGRVSDLLLQKGGTALLTEVPEMFGAETILMDRATEEAVFQKTAQLIRSFQHYYSSHGQQIYENPSPGNKAGGITTLEEKSLGCVLKGGNAPVSDVISYGERVCNTGLILAEGPGNDIVASTALAAAGAQLILFTTGRGTPLGAPVPVIKIATNTPLAEKKSRWIDFDAGRLLTGCSLSELAEEGLQKLIAVASGEQTASEKSCKTVKDFAVFKTGVTL